MTRKASDYIYTQSGKRFLPEELKSCDITLEDIAFGLARLYRFNGQSNVTVARHSIGIANCFTRPSLKYYALFHDAAEAYLMDVPVPLKKFVNTEWHVQYERIEGLILEKFGVPNTRMIKAIVSDVDKENVEYEMNCNGTMMRYPEPSMASHLDTFNLSRHYRWDLHDRFLASHWIDQVMELAVKEKYFEPPLSLL